MLPLVELSVGVLRELFRNLLWWRSLYESDGVDVLPGPDGESYSLWDIDFLYSQTSSLPPRQRQAIQLCLIENVRERDAAIRMGVSPTNPVAMYATSGLEKLVARWNSGELGSPYDRDARRLRCLSCGDGIEVHPKDVKAALAFTRNHTCKARGRAVA